MPSPLSSLEIDVVKESDMDDSQNRDRRKKKLRIRRRPITDIQLSVNPRPASHFRSRKVNRHFLSGFRRFEFAREGDCHRIPDGPQGGFPQIGAKLNTTELCRLDQRVEERRDPRAPLRPAPEVILPSAGNPPQRPLVNPFLRSCGGHPPFHRQPQRYGHGADCVVAPPRYQKMKRPES
jgi:hypothetical protein